MRSNETLTQFNQWDFVKIKIQQGFQRNKKLECISEKVHKIILNEWNLMENSEKKYQTRKLRRLVSNLPSIFTETEQNGIYRRRLRKGEHSFNGPFSIFIELNVSETLYIKCSLPYEDLPLFPKVLHSILILPCLASHSFSSIVSKS